MHYSTNNGTFLISAEIIAETQRSRRKTNREVRKRGLARKRREFFKNLLLVEHNDEFPS
jgi:hypothetical protein